MDKIGKKGICENNTVIIPGSGGRICDRRHIKDMEVLAAASCCLAHAADQEKLLKEVLSVLDKKAGFFNSTIMLLTPDGTELRVEMLSDDEADLCPRLIRYQRGEGVTGRVLETGERAIIPRVADEPNFKFKVHRRMMSDERDVSYICVPIVLENEVLGTLSVDNFAAEDERLVEYAQLLEIISTLIANDVRARRAVRMQREFMEAENRRLRNELQQGYHPDNMVGDSMEMRSVFARINQVSGTDTTVLIRGESGTGKELVAAALHYNSKRASGPFVKVNCAALSENLLESELFGHEKGAFTGALFKRIGRMEEAEGGTLFLDEIGDFSPAVQVKLLRVIQEKTFERVGSNETHKSDVRIICATNRDLEASVQDNTFREDLYYRINIFPIVLPPLRERRSDVLNLANFFAQKHSRMMGVEMKRITTAAINMLMAYHWPGNVRELENCMEHAVLLCDDGVIHANHLPPTLQMPGISESIRSRGTLKENVSMLERDLVIDALKRNDGNVTAASRELGITSRMVRYKIEKLGIDYERLFKRRSARRS